MNRKFSNLTIASTFLILALFFVAPHSAIGATDLDELVRLRKFSMANGDFKGAIWASEKIIEQNPESAAPYYMRGQVYALNKNYQSAIDDFQQAIKLDSEGFGKQPQIHYEIGLAYYGLFQYADAVKFFDEAIHIDPRHVPALAARGTAYIRIGKFDQAEADFNGILRIDPSHAMAYRNRAAIYFAVDKYKQTISDVSKCLELDPETYGKDYGAFTIRGESYYKLKKQKAALEDFETALRLNPRYVQALIDRSNIYADLHKYDLALKDLDSAVEYEPESVDALVYRGFMHIILKHLDPALEDFLKAHKLNLENPIISMFITAIYSQQKKIAEACIWLKKSVDVASKLGYDYKHSYLLTSDSYIENLRNAPCYKEIM